MDVDLLIPNSTFNHVNWEDPNINVAIPVFSIHGNHDDPSGVDNYAQLFTGSDAYKKQEGHLAALDLLQESGFINYYGRTPESDNIQVKPLLLQKGNTKLALYGMSNVRDERLFRTFRDGNVKFFQPGTQKSDWFNLMSVHQNHTAHSETNFLPEHFLPDFMDLVVWGHEHECKIDPQTNPETNFRVMQPGSSVATSLIAGEAVPKQVAIVSVRGKDFDVETIRLKTVRPFIYKDIALSDDRVMREIAQESGNQAKVHSYLIDVVEKLIEQAKEDWLELQRESGEELDEDVEVPLPLIRLRVDYTPPEGGSYMIDNPQRFSSRFLGRVANTADVVAYHRKRTAPARANKNQPDMPDEGIMAALSLDSVKVEKLVEEFLTAQSLTILPQNPFSDAVGQFVDKDDKHAMEQFVTDSLGDQVKALVESGEDDVDQDLMEEVMERVKSSLEVAFEKGELKKSKRKGSRKPKPDNWDSDEFGAWEDEPASIIRSDDEMLNGDDDEDEEGSVAPPPKRGGRGRGGKTASGTTRKTAAATKKAPAKSTASKARKKQQVVSDDEDEEEEDVVMLDDDDDEEDESQGLFVSQAKAPASKSKTTRAPAKAPAKTSTRGGKAAAATGRQTQLSFNSQANGTGTRAAGGRAAAPRRLQEPDDDEISDDDAFEPPPPATRRTARR